MKIIRKGHFFPELAQAARANFQLLAGYANRHDIPEVKVQIEFNDAPKPISSPGLHVCDHLKPQDHCDASLLAPADDT